MLTSKAPIGIMSAMPQEAESFLNAIEEKNTIHLGTHEFVQGYFEGKSVIFSLSGIGKVSAAITATLLISHFNAKEILFTGVAGGGSSAEVGDVVIGHSYLQHDLDLGSLFPPFHICNLNKQLLEADPVRVTQMKTAASSFMSSMKFPELGIMNPKVHEGAIISGDQFVDSSSDLQVILNSIKEVLPNGFHAIEMEGAAVAQVCLELGVPFVVVRSISDKADNEATFSFNTFIDKVARHYSLGILKEYFKLLSMHE